MRIVKLLQPEAGRPLAENCYITTLLNYSIALLLTVLFLTGCSLSIGEQDSVESADTGGKDLEIAELAGVEAGVGLDGKGLVNFSLDIDGEIFEVEMPKQERYTAFDVLNQYGEEQGIELVTKKYDFGMFIQGIGGKVGDTNSFWLFYVNDKLANVSVDNAEVEPGDVIKFEFTHNNPF